MPYAVPASLALLLFLVRRHYVIAPLEGELACSACLLTRQLLADGPMLAVLLLLTSLGLGVRSWPLRVLLRASALALALIYCADIFVYLNFFVRLQLRDAVIYGDQWQLVLGQLRQSLDGWQWWGLIGVAATMSGLVLWRAPASGSVRMRPLMAMAVVAVSVAFVANALWHPKFASTWVVRNVFAHNLQHGVEVAYDPVDAERLRRQLQRSPVQCVTGTPTRPSIVLLITESWSPYQSGLFSGLNDWTPRMDAIARKSRYFTNFHAGGENTDAGLVSILLGMQFYSPIKNSLSLAAFDGLWGRRSTLPKQFAALGYDTVFMTTGDLSFSRKGDWMRDIGFGEVDGHDSPEYAGAPRASFDAAPDEYLYRKALSFVAAHRSRPFLLVLENVSTHHPYMHPYLQYRSERAVFHYFDQSASRFYRELDKQGFLADNLLMVVSDHRAMTPPRRGELERLGEGAPARIPAFIASARVPPGREDAPLQQADILPSLVNHVAGVACSRQPFADLFAPAVAADRCLLHAPNSNWNEIKAYCGARTYTISLNGSRSSVRDDQDRVVADAALLDAVAMRRLYPGVSRLLPGARAGAPGAETAAP